MSKLWSSSDKTANSIGETNELAFINTMCRMTKQNQKYTVIHVQNDKTKQEN